MGRTILVVAIAAAAAGCASTGAVPRPFPGAPTAGATGSSPERPASEAVLPGRADGYSISSTALSLRGAPYRNGGSDPQGFDCSGFVHYVFTQHGVRVPRDVRQQFGLGKTVHPRDLEPGDLVFFTTVAPGASHVGIAIGGDQFVHAPSTNGVVRVEHLSSQFWANRFVGAKRVN